MSQASIDRSQVKSSNASLTEIHLIRATYRYMRPFMQRLHASHTHQRRQPQAVQNNIGWRWRLIQPEIHCKRIKGSISCPLLRSKLFLMSSSRPCQQSIVANSILRDLPAEVVQALPSLYRHGAQGQSQYIASIQALVKVKDNHHMQSQARSTATLFEASHAFQRLTRTCFWMPTKQCKPGCKLFSSRTRPLAGFRSHLHLFCPSSFHQVF